MYDPADFALTGPDDFLRLDTRCQELLEDFFAWLQGEEGGSFAPEDASQLAYAADRYLRDFVVDIQETGPADADPTLPRQYLGNWYIIHTLVPTHEEMDRIRAAVNRLYWFLEAKALIPAETAVAVADALADAAFFRDRLESFWDLEADDIPDWRSVDDYRAHRRRA